MVEASTRLIKLLTMPQTVAIVVNAAHIKWASHMALVCYCLKHKI